MSGRPLCSHCQRKLLVFDVRGQVTVICKYCSRPTVVVAEAVAAAGR